MHTAEELTASDFTYRREGAAVAREDVLPQITPRTRVGLVMGSRTAGLGAGAFVLACVTAFYDRLRERDGAFFEYPDFYTFQTVDDPTDYQMFDIYPDHKHVSVGADAESLVRAVTDRAVDVLLVPERPTAAPDISDITLRSAERRLDDLYVYAADGHLDDAELTISHPSQPASEWYQQTVRADDHVPDDFSLPPFGSEPDRTTQEYRRVTLADALARLPVDS